MSAQIIAKPWLSIAGPQHAVWVVEMANAGKRNAMTRSMWRQLREVFEALQNNAAVRCIVVQGQGDVFCAGGDISEYPDFRFVPDSLAAFHEADVWGGLQAMLACDVPMVAHISGPCMGGGLEIASCCDVRLVADNAQFGAPIAKLGFPMAPKELGLVTASVGAHTAKRMLLEASIFSAHDMASAGWCAPPLAATALSAQLIQTVERIASLAPQAARLNKQAMRQLTQAPQVQTQAQTQVLQGSAYAYAPSAEHREGVGAFLAKRAPRF